MSWPSAVVPSQCVGRRRQRRRERELVRIVDRGEQAGRDREHGEDQEQDEPDDRLLAGEHRPQQAAAAPARRCGRRGAGRSGVDEQCGHGCYAFARERGSSQAMAKSQIRSATSTATVNSMNRACMSG